MALMDTKRFFHQNQAGFQEEDTDYFFLPGNDSGSAAGFIAIRKTGNRPAQDMEGRHD
jgi:hypothetical protein